MARVFCSSRFGRRLSSFARARSGIGITAVCVGAAISLPACGGEDAGRPTGGVVGDAAADLCRAADGFDFQNIVNFETPIARCDPAVDPSNAMQTSCLYFNYDRDSDPAPTPLPPNWIPVFHSPPDCLTPFAEGTCTLPNGQLVEPGTCSSSNLIQGSIPTTFIDGDAAAPDGGGSRCGAGGRAMHLSAKNLAICMSAVTQRQGWGATLSIAFFVNGGGQPVNFYDATPWDGISFWLRKGTGPTGQAILATIRDPYTGAYATAADGGMVEGGVPEGGLCNSSNVDYCGTTAKPCTDSVTGEKFTYPDNMLRPTVADSDKCDPFGAAVLLTDDWRFVRIPFSQTSQKGFGKPAPSGRLSVTQVTGLQFALSAGSWDLWLDDIAFYRAKAR